MMDKTDEVDTNQRRGSLASLNRSQRRGSLASLYRSPNRNRTRSPSRLSISTIASISPDGISFHEIAMTGDIEDLTDKDGQLHINKALISFKDEHSMTPLHYAMKYKHFELAKQLVDRGADLDVKDSKGSTPLHYVAQFYITSNPDDEKMDNVIESIDVLFKDEEKTEQVQEQVQHPEDHQALMMATSLHQGTVIRVVDSAGEPIRKKGSIDFFAMGGDINCTNDLLQTPLHIAISVGNNMVVKQLLDKRSEINLSAKDQYGRTPLHTAAIYNRCEYIRLLIRWNKSDDLRATDNYQRTPMQLACREGNFKFVKTFLDECNDSEKEFFVKNELALLEGVGLDFDLIDFRLLKLLKPYLDSKLKKRFLVSQSISIHFATQTGNLEMLNFVFEDMDAKEMEENVNKIDNLEKSPVYIAAELNSGDVLKYLIKKGGNINQLWSQSFTSLTSNLCQDWNRFPSLSRSLLLWNIL